MLMVPGSPIGIAARSQRHCTPTIPQVKVGVLGPIELLDDAGPPLTVGSPNQRLVLAVNLPVVERVGGTADLDRIGCHKRNSFLVVKQLRVIRESGVRALNPHIRPTATCGEF